MTPWEELREWLMNQNSKNMGKYSPVLGEMDTIEQMADDAFYLHHTRPDLHEPGSLIWAIKQLEDGHVYTATHKKGTKLIRPTMADHFIDVYDYPGRVPILEFTGWSIKKSNAGFGLDPL